MYLAYSAGVVAHNHNHSRVFAGRGANAFLSAWVSFFYGHPVFAWIPTHNRNHHRYVNRPGDATITSRHGSANTAWAAFSFFFASSAAQGPLIADFLAHARRHAPATYARYLSQYAVVIGGHVGALALALALHGSARGALVYGSALGIPALFALWGLMFTNYVQHVECDAESKWNHSRNFASPWMNYLLFDNGFHTVHHQRPGLHWSRLPAEHARVAHRIDPRLNESSIFAYCFKTYLSGRRVVVGEPRHVVETTG
jgi:beta-carotene hydroxylase